MKKYIISFIKEIVPIIAGILIALYINNWNDSRKEEQYINHINDSIDQELASTHEDINSMVPEQKLFVDTLDFYLNDDQVSILDIAMRAGGIKMPTIKINSWRAISYSKIELMAFERISILAEIEDKKDILSMKAEKLTSYIYANTEETGKDKKALMRLMMLDIVSTELSIKESIGMVLKDESS